MESRHDLRRNDRHCCDHKITVMWRDLSGQDKFVNAKALDISEFGLQIQMRGAAAMDLPGAQRFPSWADGTCLGAPLCAYSECPLAAVGLEFTAGLRWTLRN